MRRGSILRMVAVGVLAGVVASAIAVFIPWLPDPASEEMDRIAFTYWFTTVICIAIFALVAAVIVYSVLKFRARPDDDGDGPPIHGHTGLEIAWTAVPTILVTAIAVVSGIVLAKNGDAGPNPLRVAVTAQQFAWRFEYPQNDGVTSSELVLPIGQKTKLTLRSVDVIHSFWVPEFGQKSDVVPGIETTLVITPNRTGDFDVVCTELCGLGHSLMRSRARVVSQEEFDTWLREQREGGAPTGGEDGASVFTSAGCGGCHAFQPAGTDSQVGPGLDELAASAERAGEPLEQYVREAIVNPEAYVVPGYQEGVMPTTYGQTLSEEQIDALVTYLTEGAE